MKSRPGGEMADATDLKSVGTSMRVRVPPRAFDPIFRKNMKEIDENPMKIWKKALKNSFFFLYTQ